MNELLILVLRSYFNDCTLSRVKTSSKLDMFALELPYLGNINDKSCIEEGDYEAYVRYSPNQGREVITLKDVPGRTWINIEVGNYTSDILGCVIVGDGIRDINSDGIPDVTNSVKVHNKLMADAKKAESIKVRIKQATKPGRGVYL